MNMFTSLVLIFITVCDLKSNHDLMKESVSFHVDSDNKVYMLVRPVENLVHDFYVSAAVLQKYPNTKKLKNRFRAFQDELPKEFYIGDYSEFNDNYATYKFNKIQMQIKLEKHNEPENSYLFHRSSSHIYWKANETRIKAYEKCTIVSSSKLSHYTFGLCKPGKICTLECKTDFHIFMMQDRYYDLKLVYEQSKSYERRKLLDFDPYSANKIIDVNISFNSTSNKYTVTFDTLQKAKDEVYEYFVKQGEDIIASCLIENKCIFTQKRVEVQASDAETTYQVFIFVEVYLVKKINLSNTTGEEIPNSLYYDWEKDKIELY